VRRLFFFLFLINFFHFRLPSYSKAYSLHTNNAYSPKPHGPCQINFPQIKPAIYPRSVSAGTATLRWTLVPAFRANMLHQNPPCSNLSKTNEKLKTGSAKNYPQKPPNYNPTLSPQTSSLVIDTMVDLQNKRNIHISSH